MECPRMISKVGGAIGAAEDTAHGAAGGIMGTGPG
jgi:hypothetical protein